MLSKTEMTALKTFAVAHGRRWKSELQVRWEHANCSPELMRVRNKIGPSGLSAIRQLDLDNAKLPPTPTDEFIRATSLALEIVALTILGERKAADKLTDDESAWFVVHVDHWVRWFHANDRIWRSKLQSRGNAGRDRVYTFVNHWLDAYLKNPAQYQERHPIAELG